MVNKFSFSELLLIVEDFSIDFNYLLDEGGIDRYGVKFTDVDLIRESEINYDRLSAYIKVLQELYTYRPLSF